MNAPKNKSNKTKTCSKAQFAREIGISRQNLNYHIQTGNAPAIGDVEAWLAFLAEQGRDATLPKKLREAIAKERLRLIKENVEKAKMENAEKRGEMIAFDKVRAFLHNIIGTFFFGELARLEAEFPAALKGQTEIEIQAECKRQISKIKEELRVHLTAWEQKKV